MKLYKRFFLLRRKIYKYSVNLVRSFSFKKFGRKSVVFHPILLNGREYTEIGEYVTILNGARIEALVVNKLEPKLIIGDRTNIGQDVHITAGGGGVLKIGADCTFAPRVMVTNIDHVYDDLSTHVLQQPLIVNETVLGDGCFIGMNSCIFPGVHLGKHVVVGANTIVTKDVPDYCVVVGNPSKIIKKYNEINGQWERC